MTVYNTSDNIYFHCKVERIQRVITDNGFEFVEIKVQGRTSYKDELSPEKEMKYRSNTMTAYAVGSLGDYAEAELMPKDDIFIVGKLVTKFRKRGTVNYPEQVIHAEYIYKEEWMKFYGHVRL